MPLIRNDRLGRAIVRTGRALAYVALAAAVIAAALLAVATLV